MQNLSRVTIEQPKQLKSYKFNRVHFSSLYGKWSTDDGLFDELDKEFNFVLDACAEAGTAKCAKFFTVEDNALVQDWYVASGFGAGAIWCNPPYGRGVIDWVRKGFDESRKGCCVVMLLASRTDTLWFSEYAARGEVRFIQGRLRFGNAKNSAPFPSVVIIFDGSDSKFQY
jgi:site-specific DNA-methyltransferase (adenine-specific)